MFYRNLYKGSCRFDYCFHLVITVHSTLHQHISLGLPLSVADHTAESCKRHTPRLLLLSFCTTVQTEKKSSHADITIKRPPKNRAS